MRTIANHEKIKPSRPGVWAIHLFANISRCRCNDRFQKITQCGAIDAKTMSGEEQGWSVVCFEASLSAVAQDLRSAMPGVDFAIQVLIFEFPPAAAQPMAEK